MSKFVRFDWAIKYLLRNKADFVVLEGFLSELINQDIFIEEILESESNKTHKNDKSNRVDLLVKNNNHEYIIIEIQCYQELDFLSRMLYGTSKVVTESIESGDKYINIAKIISVNIVYFDMGQGTDYLYKGTTNFKGIHKKDILELNEKEKSIYLNKGISNIESIFPEYYLIRVDNYNNKINDKIDEWIYFLKNSSIKSSFKAKGIKEANDKLNVLRLSEDQRIDYEIDMRNLSLDNSLIYSATQSGLIDGIKIGKEEGIKEGEKKKALKIAKNLLKSKISIKKIAKATGLSISEIEKL